MTDFKSFLWSVKDAQEDLDDARFQVESLRTVCEKSTTAWSDAPGHSSDDVHKDSNLIQLAEAEDLVKTLEADVKIAQKRVGAFLDRLPERKTRRVLKGRYLYGSSISMIAYSLEKIGLPHSERFVKAEMAKGTRQAEDLWNRLYGEEGRSDD